MTKRARTALVVAATLFVFGVIDAVWVIVITGWTDGIRYVAHDPGKSLFHVIVLPVAAALIVWRFPTDVARAAFGRRGMRLAAGAIAVLLALGLAWVGEEQMEAGVETRVPWPSLVRAEHRHAIQTAERASRGLIEAGPAPGAAAYEQYKAAVESEFPNGREFWRDASTRALWAGFLTILGTLCAAAVLWIVFLYALMLQKPSQSLTDALSGVITLALIWFLFRAYSEWYSGFGKLQGYPGFGLAILCVLIVFLTIRALRKRKTTTVVSVIVGGISAAIAGVSQFKPEWFTAGARHFSTLPHSMVFCAYVVVIIALILYARMVLLGGPDTPASTQDDE